MHGCLKALLLAGLFAASTLVLADDDDSYTGFDSIVSQLETAAEDAPPAQVDDWDEVALHGGVGFVVSNYQIHEVKGSRSLAASGMMKGFQAHFGMNMFSRNVLMEGIFRKYSSDNISNAYVVDLKEFELRGVFLPMIRGKMKMRAGAGLTARYMSLNNDKASTPFASVLVGFERMLTPTMAVGPDFSYRSALTSDTFDKSAWDASIRLNATF